MIGPIAVAGAVVLSVSLVGAALAGEGGRPMPESEPSETTSTDARAVPGWGLIPLLGAIGVAAGWLLAGVPGAVGGTLAGVVAPVALERRRVARRARAIEGQLIDVVAAIASAVRAGRSLGQSLAIAADEVGRPLGGLLAQAADRSSLGVPFDQILDDLARDIGGADARLVAGVLRLHRRAGGALVASLDDLTRTLRARRDGGRELRSLTAQARLSAAILGLLPLGFFLFLSIVARSDVEAAYRSAAGASAIAVGLALQVAAFVWIRRLLRVEDS
ncbi:MAG TPA: type II secretion system F family protein [Actinomycetota bacterium]